MVFVSDIYIIDKNQELCFNIYNMVIKKTGKDCKMAQKIDIQTNPQPTEQVDNQKMLKRLAQKSKRLEGVNAMMNIGGMGLAGGAAVVGVMGGGLYEATLGTMIGVPLLAIAYAAKKRREKVHAQMKEMSKKIKGDAYYQNIINKEKETLSEYERYAKGEFTNSEKMDYNTSRLQKEAKESIPEQQKYVTTLEQSHNIARQCGKERTVRRLTDLLENTPVRHLETKTATLLGGIATGVGMAGLTQGFSMSGVDFVPPLVLAVAGGFLIRDIVKQRKKEAAADRSLQMLKNLVKSHKQEKV